MTHSQDWQRFWQQASNCENTASGIHEEALENCWRNILTAELVRRNGTVQVVDLACGNGALSRQIAAAAGETTIALSCVDISPAALQALAQGLPEAQIVTASAADTGLPDAAFDLVVSQFGLEYAGPEALTEARRLMAPGATLALLQHRRDSIIDYDSAAAAACLKKVEDIDLLGAFRQLMQEADALQRKMGSLQRCEDADRLLSTRVEQFKAMLAGTQSNPATSVVHKLYQDIAHMYQKMGHFAPSEILTWIDAAETELTAFAGRMSSMVNAAIDESTFNANARKLQDGGLEVSRTEGISLSDGRPAAWLTVAHKPS